MKKGLRRPAGGRSRPPGPPPRSWRSATSSGSVSSSARSAPPPSTCSGARGWVRPRPCRPWRIPQAAPQRSGKRRGGFETRPYMVSNPPLRFVDEGVGFDLDQDLGSYEAADLDHARGGTDFAEALAVGRPDLLPVLDVDDVDPGPDHVGEISADSLERHLDVVYGLDGLRVGISYTNVSPAPVRGCGPRDVHETTAPDGPRVADPALPYRAAGYVLPLHDRPRRKVPSHSTSLASQESPAFELLPETCSFRRVFLVEDGWLSDRR